MVKRLSTLQVSFFFLMFGCCWIIVIGLQATSPSPIQTRTSTYHPNPMLKKIENDSFLNESE